MKTIAIIDDDIRIGDMLEEVLRREGYGVLRGYSGTEAVYLLERERPDLVLLDLMLPGLTGEEVLPKIQGIPVIVLSAKAEADSKIGLLLGGAADYITKPFDTGELLARMLRAGDLTLDTAAHTVSAGGQEARLTKTEYAILKLLMQNPRQAIAKSVILDRISE